MTFFYCFQFSPSSFEKINHLCCFSLIINQERVKEGREIFSIIVTLSFHFRGLIIIKLCAFCFNNLCNLTSLFTWGHHQLKNTTHTCYDFYCNCCGFCYKVWTFTRWSFSPLHSSYLLWFCCNCCVFCYNV